MKIWTTGFSALCLLGIGAAANGEVLFTQSFENPDGLGGQYVDATVDGGSFDHDLINYDGMSWVDGDGFDATFISNGPSQVGLTDGDFVGLTDYVGSGSPGGFTDGSQGYQLSDIDGIMVLTLSAVAGADSVSLDFWLRSTGYETTEPNVDFLTITAGGETGIDTTGSDIDDLDIEGEWRTLTWTGLTDSEVVITFSSNSGSEALFIDNVVWEGEAIPAPGALALLGLGGLAARRRRA
jgi:MYXO-CTERM domain-containing protein